MRGAKILSTGRYIPKRVVKNEEFESFMDTSDEWITQRTGIKERHYAEGDETTSFMGAMAGKNAMEKVGLAPGDVDFVIFATLSPDYYFPGCGVFVQETLGLDTVGALDVRNQCSGFVYGLSVAESYVKMGKFENVLVIGSEVQSAGLDFSTEGRDVTVIFGDGAGAALVSPCEEGKGILATNLHSEGKHGKELWCEAPSSSKRPWISEEMLREKRHYPYMNGRNVFVHAVKRFRETIEDVLESNSLTLDDMSMLIPHQANLRICQAIAKSLGIGDEKVFCNIEKYGNTTAASIPIALDECIESGRISEGDLICLAAFGSGFTWGSALIRC